MGLWFPILATKRSRKDGAREIGGGTIRSEAGAGFFTNAQVPSLSPA
jgi:hypothetical protein